MAKRTSQENGNLRQKPDKLLAEADIPLWFEAKRDAITGNGKSPPTADLFESLAEGAGTHLLKLTTARAKISQSVLRVTPPGSNEMPSFQASVDVKLFKSASIVFDKIPIRGHPARRLVDHLTAPDDLSPKVCEAFAAIFGTDALDALRTALAGEARPITQLPAAEFPIVFMPHPEGGDLQITPLAPAEAHVNFRQVTAPFFEKFKEGHPRPRRGRWHRQVLTGKSQNIGYAIPNTRQRFWASMPDVLGRQDAALHAWLNGGPFPRWTDPNVNEVVLGYADLLDRAKTYSNTDIRAGLNARADALIRAARTFRDEILAEADHQRDEAELRNAPSETDILLKRRWKNDERSRARAALLSPHFRDRVGKVR